MAMSRATIILSLLVFMAVCLSVAAQQDIHDKMTPEQLEAELQKIQEEVSRALSRPHASNSLCRRKGAISVSLMLERAH